MRRKPTTSLLASGRFSPLAKACHLLASVALICSLDYASVSAQSWSRFRGPNGSGLSLATTVPARWSDDDYNWKIDLPGGGHSSPVTWAKKIFVTSGDQQSGQRFVLCVDADSGQTLWSRQFKANSLVKHKLNSFASPTPAVDAERVYLCWGAPDELIVLALDHQGKLVWRADLGRADLGGYKSGYGPGVSPIVYDDLLILPKEHDGESSLMALDKSNGKIRWQVARESKSTWSTPCVFRRSNGPDELIFVAWTSGVTAIDPKTGQTNWQADVFDKKHVETSIGSPIVAGDIVLAMSGWMGVRQEVIAVRVDAKQKKVNPQRVYCIDRAAPLCVTPLVKDDLLFLWSDQGIVTCHDLATGQVHWRKRVGGAFYSSPVCAGNHLYNISADGEVVVLAASVEYRELGRNDLGETCYATPAISHGVMYLRTLSHLFSIGGKTK